MLNQRSSFTESMQNMNKNVKQKKSMTGNMMLSCKQGTKLAFETTSLDFTKDDDHHALLPARKTGLALEINPTTTIPNGNKRCNY
jgi:hypothetical protein